MYSLIRFIAIEPFSVKSHWSHHISKPIRFNHHSQSSLALSRLQTLMKSITLRRTKDQKIDGHSILNVPPKFEQTVLLDLDHQERELYQKIHSRASNLVKGLERTGTVVRVFLNTQHF